jgi:hypothetical protein
MKARSVTIPDVYCACGAVYGGSAPAKHTDGCIEMFLKDHAGHLHTLRDLGDRWQIGKKQILKWKSQ